jgi:hypothetical protein
MSKQIKESMSSTVKMRHSANLILPNIKCQNFQSQDLNINHLILFNVQQIHVECPLF